MQISTSVGVVQDILISLSFQKNAKLIVDPSRSQDQPAGICVKLPCGGIGVSPSLRSSRASEANVPERAIAHRRKRADRRLLDAPSEGGHNQYFKVAIRRPVHVCPDIPRVFRGHAGNRTHTRPQSATCAERAIRLLSPRLLVVPRSVSIHSPPTALFLGLLSRRLAPVPPLGSLEMTSVFPCFCPSPY